MRGRHVRGRHIPLRARTRGVAFDATDVAKGVQQAPSAFSQGRFGAQARGEFRVLSQIWDRRVDRKEPWPGGNEWH